MSIKKKGLISIIAIIALIMGLIILKTVIAADSIHSFQWGSLTYRQKSVDGGNDYSTVFCLAHNYHLSSSPTTYRLYKRIAIEGDKATVGTKTTTKVSNAKLAYIFYNSIGNDLSSTGTEDSDVNQNAMWKYWPTWWNKNASDLGISSSNFSMKTTPPDSNKAKEVIDAAEDYYNVLKGDSGISVKTTVKGIKSTCTKKNNKWYVGPFRIVTSSKFINNITDISGVKGYSNSLGGEIKNKIGDIKVSSENGFYIVFDNEPSTKTPMTLNYKVTKINAYVNLYYKGGAYSRQQPIASGYATTTTENLKLEFYVKESNKDFSLQKFIVQHGGKAEWYGANYQNLKITPSINEEKYNAQARISRNAVASSNSEIHIVNNNLNKSANPTSSKDFYKKQNPVKISSEGNIVVYRIDVYNNTGDSGEVVVRDRINKIGSPSLIGIFDDCASSNTGEITYTNSYTETDKSSWDDNDLKEKTGEYIKYEGKDINNYDYYKWAAHVGGYTKQSFWVIVEYQKEFSGISDNKAYITGEKASDIYRTVDYDYVRMQTSNVSLQKYITKINGNSLTTNDTTLAARANRMADARSIKRISTNNDSTIESSTYKSNNVVGIEAGDAVTYAITVYNNGNSADEVNVRDYLPTYATGYYWGDYNASANVTELNGNDNIENPKTTDYNKIVLAAGESRTLYITVIFDNYIKDTVLKNEAEITSTKYDNDTTYRVDDEDYIKMKEYKVSLEKYVSRVRHNNAYENTTGRSGKAEYLTDNTYVDNTDKDTQWTRHNTTKSDSPVNVENGDEVEYTIKLNNDGDTRVYITEVTDYLPDGIMHNAVKYNGGQYDKKDDYNMQTDNAVKFNGTEINGNQIIDAHKSVTFTVTVTVTESNMSLNVLKNVAEITQMKNKNGKVVQDTTPYNNKDADYIQLKDITIGGMVWNDKALNKTQDNYNGLYDSNSEKGIPNIPVILYNASINRALSTTTDDNGKYSFATNYIKGPKTGNRWSGIYYSFYIIYTYDGITYTSTFTPEGVRYVDVTDPNSYNGNSTKYKINSNAAEDIGKVSKTRANFNTAIDKLNKRDDVSYTTKNENGYLPQSNYVYDSNKMAMQSSTNLINLEDVARISDKGQEALLQNINLGLRGRDIFDLELTSDVYSTKVTVNGQPGTYNYNSNRVTVRKADIGVAEDAANFASEVRQGNISKVDQSVRNTDKSYLTSVEVTYKIRVTNASRTDGTATKIINYYDDMYECIRAYSGESNLSVSNSTGGSGYKSVIINTPGTNITQGNSMDIYVVYRLSSSGIGKLKTLGTEGVMPTYNMAEVYEYSTKCASGQTEYTRGLIDKDSAPGSVKTEKVRLSNGNSNLSTVDYYFNKQNLNVLKYEDDTYATPTLYFVSDNNKRTLSGYVFEDETLVDKKTKIKSGNGIKDSGEKVVYGATVTLTVPGSTKTYTTTTNKDGYYEIKGFIPGSGAFITYQYGNTKETVLLHQSDANKQNGVNKRSYNGEDYQSTNNKDLSNKANYWYLDNESKGVSVAEDDDKTRKQVSDRVATYDDSKMELLNKIRSGTIKEETDAVKQIKNDTKMNAKTKNFVLNLEKGIGQNNYIVGKDTTYKVENMNFGIAEVPVTTIDLQKSVSSFTIKDSTGQNVLASWDNNNHIGNVKQIEKAGKDGYDIEIEDDKLQGARLEIKYDISSKINVEKNFDNTDGVKITINGLADFIDNNLSYNEALGDNSKYWKVVNRDNLISTVNNNAKYINSEGKQITPSRNTTLDPEGKVYTTIVNATDNALTKLNNGEIIPITLERTLSSQDVTVGDIITSAVESFDYTNNVEITGISYKNNTEDDKYVHRDRVRTPKTNNTENSWMIILAGAQHDTAGSETIAIHPPTGENNNMIYYVVAITSLAVLVVGVVLIRRCVIKKIK